MISVTDAHLLLHGDSQNDFDACHVLLLFIFSVMISHSNRLSHNVLVRLTYNVLDRLTHKVMVSHSNHLINSLSHGSPLDQKNSHSNYPIHSVRLIQKLAGTYLYLHSHCPHPHPQYPYPHPHPHRQYGKEVSYPTLQLIVE